MEQFAFCLAFSKCEGGADALISTRHRSSARPHAGAMLFHLHSAHLSPTFVVARDPLHAVSKSDFSPNQVSENSNLIHKTQMDSAAKLLARAMLT